MKKHLAVMNKELGKALSVKEQIIIKLYEGDIKILASKIAILAIV